MRESHEEFVFFLRQHFQWRLIHTSNAIMPSSVFQGGKTVHVNQLHPCLHSKYCFHCTPLSSCSNPCPVTTLYPTPVSLLPNTLNQDRKVYTFVYLLSGCIYLLSGCMCGKQKECYSQNRPLRWTKRMVAMADENKYSVQHEHRYYVYIYIYIQSHEAPTNSTYSGVHTSTCPKLTFRSHPPFWDIHPNPTATNDERWARRIRG